MTWGEIVPRQSIGRKKSMNVHERTFQTMSLPESRRSRRSVSFWSIRLTSTTSPVNRAAAKRHTASALVRDAGCLSLFFS
jgi:hypothetical protein